MSRTKFDYPTEYTDEDLAELHAERAKVAKLREAMIKVVGEMEANNALIYQWVLGDFKKVLDETK